jgi:hypothetical protein
LTEWLIKAAIHCVYQSKALVNCVRHAKESDKNSLRLIQKGSEVECQSGIENHCILKRLKNVVLDIVLNYHI